MTFHYGGNFDRLRPDQQAYVMHLLRSWGHDIYWLPRFAMRRAIKKAKQNHP